MLGLHTFHTNPLISQCPTLSNDRVLEVELGKVQIREEVKIREVELLQEVEIRGLKIREVNIRQAVFDTLLNSRPLRGPRRRCAASSSLSPSLVKECDDGYCDPGGDYSERCGSIQL